MQLCQVFHGIIGCKPLGNAAVSDDITKRGHVQDQDLRHLHGHHIPHMKPLSPQAHLHRPDIAHRLAVGIQQLRPVEGQVARRCWSTQAKKHIPTGQCCLPHGGSQAAHHLLDLIARAPKQSPQEGQLAEKLPKLLQLQLTLQRLGQESQQRHIGDGVALLSQGVLHELRDPLAEAGGDGVVLEVLLQGREVPPLLLLLLVRRVHHRGHGAHHGGEGDQGDHCRGDGVDPLRGVGGLDLRGAHAQLADGPVEARGVAVRQALVLHSIRHRPSARVAPGMAEGPPPTGDHVVQQQQKPQVHRHAAAPVHRPLHGLLEVQRRAAHLPQAQHPHQAQQTQEPQHL
mmetsp:Transcript_96283/g.229293  ORF Transcript_96283/g.229293 Transcript_96283/m.229293 type:complete len:342 (+) Transcript_96283:360-1385(+)